MQVSPDLPQVDIFNAILNNAPLSGDVKAHINRVYQILAVFLAASAVGCAAQIQYAFGGILTMIGVIASTFWFVLTRYNGVNESKRILIGSFMAFFTGASLGPVISYVTETEGYSMILSALGLSAAVFACFSAAALFSDAKRTFIYTAGFLSSLGIASLTLLLGSLFFGVNHSAMLALGLVIFSTYVIFDTQIMIIQAQMGYKDAAGHAMQLFLDSVNLFIRILKLLSKKNKKN